MADLDLNGKVRVRFAPSPTGALHIGGGHTALFNWLWARHFGDKGCFVLRIEDTDLVRSTKEYEQTIMDGMNWLGLDWDEGPDKGGDYGPYRQSERLDLYRKYALQLVDQGLAYKDGDAIIFKVERGQDLSFDDCVYGRVECMSDGLKEKDSDNLKDIVLIKSDGMPTYNYAVVIDDHLMAMTHVIRGEDHISNTPKQILIYRALGWDTPKFAHLPMILGKDKKKLSKRHGATSVYEYRDMGYMPDSMFNFLALLGWSAGDDREIFSRAEAAEWFDLARVARRPAVFDMDKLNYINQEHLKLLDPDVRLSMVKPFWLEMNLPVDQIVKERGEDWLASSLTMMAGRGRTAKEMAEYSDYFVSFEPVKARWDINADASMTPLHKESLREFFKVILAVPDWTPEALEAKAREWVSENGGHDGRSAKMKDYAMPLRYALTGMKVSPGIFEVAVHFGKAEVTRRLKHYGLAD